MKPSDELRPALYHRFHWLVPLYENRAARRLWRVFCWLAIVGYFAFVALVLALRYSVLPHIENYRGDLERLASQRLGQSVSIGHVAASWQGISPDLTLLDVRIADAEGRPALAFSRVQAVLSWWSIPRLELNLRLLRIEEPTLNLRRDAAGKFFIAGIPLGGPSDDGALADWVLAQSRIRIEGATLVWEDELRRAPQLILEDANLALDNDGRAHRFGLTALPPEALAAKIDVRGELRGRHFAQLRTWTGQAYAELGYTDLAVWQRWIDYPLALSRGRGAFRAWLGFKEGRVSEVTSDVALQDVSLQLAENLPVLDLERVSGRIDARLPAKGFEVNGRHVEVLTRERASLTGATGRPAEKVELPDANASGAGPEAPLLRIAPTDFHVDWQPLVGGKDSAGSASASALDLGDLRRLADYLPLDARSRQWLAQYAPQGQVTALSAKWKGNADALQTYTLKTGFSALSWKAQGDLPGASGLTGVLEMSEKAGQVSLNAQHPTLDLPGVFPVSLIEMDSLKAQAGWKYAKGVLDVELAQAEFAGPDAAGSARGTYRNTGEGPGVIDMTAALTRGNARAVWRYMPHVVGEGAREWLRDSLISGSSPEARLVLKGNLADFPFADKRSGQFLVTVKARDVVLDYGKGWPRIEGIDGDLRFEGTGMVVNAQQGRLLGARLSATRAEIPDFDKPISTLTIKGQAEGPTAEFLKFIEQSPVGERIDHFTQDMRATGNGALQIGLMIPLDAAKLAESTIDGTYQFKNNEVTVDSALPPIRQVSGHLRFTGNEIKIPEITGSLFGGPLKIKGETQKDGRVAILANGTANLAQLRKPGGSPWLDNLSGTLAYRGEVRVTKRTADLSIDSNLVGLSSTLPEPLGKAATDVLPLHFEKKSLPAASASANAAPRDQINLSLGKLLTAQLTRRKQNDGFVVEQGALAVGRPLSLPANGLVLGVTAKRLDLDAWQKALRPAKSGAGGNGAAAEAWPLPETIGLRADELIYNGRHLADVDLTATSSPGAMKIRLASRQASGDLLWESAGRGKLTARLKQLQLEPSALEGGETTAQSSVEELPALDVIADEFSLGTRRFGRLELQARNEGGLWHLNRIQLSNPAGELTGSGQWQTGNGRSRTQLAFKIDSNDAGKLLDRVGYPGTMRAGTAHLEGNLAWSGSPVDFDYATLSGNLVLDAAKGQFLKLDPGAAGKLLGLVSLQGLQRRLTFDFNDVFSKGFAFDSATSKVSVSNGVMHTDRLQIDGPAARVLMRGDVDLKHETQRLNVNVQPEMGGTAAIGMAIVNPVAGVATWVAHKVLQNPLNQIFSYEYLVTGTWDDPKVEKTQRQPVAPVNPGTATSPAEPVQSPSGGSANESAKQ